jgi:hypothetical protein
MQSDPLKDTVRHQAEPLGRKGTSGADGRKTSPGIDGESDDPKATGRPGPTSGGPPDPTAVALVTAAESGKAESDKDLDGGKVNTPETLSPSTGPGEVIMTQSATGAGKENTAEVLEPLSSVGLAGTAMPITVDTAHGETGEVDLSLNPTSASSGKADGQAEKKQSSATSHGEGGGVEGQRSPHRPISPPPSTFSTDDPQAKSSVEVDVVAGAKAHPTCMETIGAACAPVPQVEAPVGHDVRARDNIVFSCQLADAKASLATYIQDIAENRNMHGVPCAVHANV